MKLTRNTKIAIIIIIILIIIFAISLTFFLLSNKENRDLYLEQKIRITAFEQTLGEYELEKILELSPQTEFQATYKPNNMKPIERTYTGVYLKDLITALNVDIESVNYIKFSASDGMQKVYSVDDIKEANNVYIAYLVNGKPFNKGILSS